MTARPDELKSLIDAQIADYRCMADEMQAQEEALNSGNVETLMQVLGRKNKLVESIGARDSEMRHIATSGVSVNDETKNRLLDLKKVAAELLEREEKSLIKLNELRSAKGKEALGRTTAKRAAQAYGAKVPPQEPRFLDKNE